VVVGAIAGRSVKARLTPGWLGALVAVLGLAVVVLRARVAGIGWTLPLDDAWIHAAFARNLAEHGRWGLVLGASSAGETSPLYAPLLAVAERVSPGQAPQTALLLGAGAFVLLPLLCARLMRGFAFPLAVALCGPLLFHATSGMESLPFLLVGVASLAAFASGRSTMAVVLAGLAAWLRLDALVLLFALWIGEADFRRAAGRRWSSTLSEANRVILPGLVLWLGAMAFLAVAEGSFPPTTLAGRRWLIGLAPQWTLGGVGEGCRAFMRAWAGALSADLGFGQFSTRTLGAVPALSVFLRHGWKLMAALLIATGAWRVGSSPASDRRRAAGRLLLLWCLWSIFEYCVLLPSRGHGGRYQIVVYPALLLCIVAGGRWLHSRGSWMRTLALVSGTWVAAGLLAGWWEGARLRTEAARHLHDVHVRAVDELSERVPADALVAAFDVGILAYRHPVAWLDMSALSEPGLAATLHTRQLARWLLEKKATHVLFPIQEDDGPGSLRDRLGLLETDGIVLELVAAYESPPESWGHAFLFSGNVLRRLLLYRIVAWELG